MPFTLISISLIAVSMCVWWMFPAAQNNWFFVFQLWIVLTYWLKTFYPSNIWMYFLFISRKCTGPSTPYEVHLLRVRTPSNYVIVDNILSTDGPQFYGITPKSSYKLLYLYLNITPWLTRLLLLRDTYSLPTRASNF